MPPLEELSREELIAHARALRQEHAAKAAQIAELELQVKLLRELAFAPSSERSRVATVEGQQQIFSVPVEQQAAPAAPESEPQRETETITYERTKPRRGRQALPRELSVQELELEVPVEQRTGPDGEPLVLLGHEVSERLHLIPEQYVRLLIKRQRWGLRDTGETLVVAPPLRALIPKGKASDAFVHEIIVRKYLLGLPLYRQAADLASRGVDVADSWLGDCVRQAAGVYAPIHAAIRAQVLENRFVHADETPIRQLASGGAAARTGYLWAWLGGGQVSFHYGQTRAQHEVADVLGIDGDGRWERSPILGFLVCDGYAGYNLAFEADGHRCVRVACWAHVRRRFVELAEYDRNAAETLPLINEIFRVDREARRQADKDGLDGPAREGLLLERRRSRARPLIDQLKLRLAELVPHYGPNSAMARAIAYTRGLWDALLVYLDHGFLPMDNNAAERAIRPLTVGRKNFLFVGSEDGGAWAACFYSIIESCRLQGIDPRRYFAYATPRLVAGEAGDPATLTPKALAPILAAKN